MIYFEGRYGEDFVKIKQYEFSTEDGNYSVQANNWSLLVKRGTVLVMSMVDQKVALLDKGKARTQRICPHCYRTVLGVMEDEGWL